MKHLMYNGQDLANHKNSLKLTQEQKDIIIGTLLGDSHIPLSKTKLYSIKFCQSEKHMEYIYHLFEIFKEWSGKLPKKREYNDKRYNDMTYISYSFETYKNKALCFYYNQFYCKDRNKKKVPKLLHRWLNDRALAYWFMDDGSGVFNKNGKLVGIHFSTENYEYFEQKLLAKVLGTNFGFQVSIHKHGKYYRLYLSQKDLDKFKLLIKPYLLESFDYKIKDRIL